MLPKHVSLRGSTARSGIIIFLLSFPCSIICTCVDLIIVCMGLLTLCVFCYYSLPNLFFLYNLLFDSLLVDKSNILIFCTLFILILGHGKYLLTLLHSYIFFLLVCLSSLCCIFISRKLFNST